jgi:acyl-CoA thioester hydrolase
MAQPVSTSVRLKVPYYDVDMMQIVWHGHYLKYFDVARQALFRERGVDLHRYMEEKGYAFPIVRCIIKHISPLRFDDEFVCTAVLKEATVKIVLDFEIKLISNYKVCTRGRSEQVALRVPEMEMAFLIPEEIKKALFGKEELKL